MQINVKASQLGWNDSIELTNNTIANVILGRPSIAINRSNLYVVWESIYNGGIEGNRSEIFCKISRDNGRTWGDSIRLTHNASTSNNPVIAADGNNIHVVWVDFRNSESISRRNGEIYYKVSRDDGKTWSNDTRLTYDTHASYEPAIAVDEDNIYVLWKDYRNGAAEIYYKVSRDNGYTWSRDIRLTHDDTPSYRPAIAVNKSNIHVVWQDIGKKHEIYYMCSADSGNTWTGYVLLSHSTDDSEQPTIAVNKNNIYVVWQDYRNNNYDIYCTISRDNGKTWGRETRLTCNVSDSVYPKIAVDDNDVHIVWMDNRDGKWAVYYIVSRDNGNTWSRTIRLSPGNDSYDPDIAVCEKHIHVVWQDYGEITNINYRQKSNQPPHVESLTLSTTSTHKNDPITIYIDGGDKEDDKSNLTCKLQYRPPFENWTTLDVTFVNNHWESTLVLKKDARHGFYNFRAKLIDTAMDESRWFENLNGLKILEEESGIPGFELLLLILAIAINIILWLYK